MSQLISNSIKNTTQQIQQSIYISIKIKLTYFYKRKQKGIQTTRNSIKSNKTQSTHLALPINYSKHQYVTFSWKIFMSSNPIQNNIHPIDANAISKKHQRYFIQIATKLQDIFAQEESSRKKTHPRILYQQLREEEEEVVPHMLYNCHFTKG